MRRRVYVESSPYTAYEIQHFDEYVQEQMELKKEQELKIGILRGPSGSGKSCALKDAARRCGGRYHSVRGFLAGDLDSEKPDLLFLDGLDEMRMGMEDWKAPLDEMIKKLRSFKGFAIISCRDCYWLSSDLSRIREAFKKKPHILELAPLSKSEICTLLTEILKEVEEESEKLLPSFLEWISGQRLFHALKFPFLMVPLFRIWCRHKEDQTRLEDTDVITRIALQYLREPNKLYREDQLAKDVSGEQSDASLLRIAGRICFLLVFSGKPSIGGDSPQSFDINQLSSDDRRSFDKLRGTPLFTKDGNSYRVRWGFIASFLAARYMHVMIEGGEISWNRAFGLFFRTKTVPRLWQECFFFIYHILLLPAAQ